MTTLAEALTAYRICARTEGKSDKTILIATTALNKLRQFLESRGYPTDVIEIGTQELREFILYLQQVRAFEYHPYTRPQTRGLSGHAINTYLRSIRAFWSWLVREEVITSNPSSKVNVPKPPRKVIATFSEKQLTTDQTIFFLPFPWEARALSWASPHMSLGGSSRKPHGQLRYTLRRGK